MKFRWFLVFIVALFGTTYLFNPIAYADPSQSTNYQLKESVIGGSGIDFSESNSFQSAQASGVLGAGNSLGTNFQVNNGVLTTGDPALSFAILTSTVGFGNFSPGAATVATSTFQVSNYTSFGYVVQILGNPPKDSVTNHTITAMSSTTASQAGTEQFGINLVANTSPVSVGANPDHGQFGFGSASSNYGTTNNYRFVSGETIASAPKTSGVTVYTISYLINVNSLTPSGQYNSDLTLVCTGTY